MPLSRIVLIAAVALFAIYVLLQFRPRQHQRKALDSSIRDARARAYATKSVAERAVALADAGEAAARAKRWVAAGGYFLRAMRADPHSVEVILRAAASLRPRPRRAEQLLWRRLGARGEHEVDGAVHAAAAGALASLYERPLRDRSKARAMRRLEELEKASS